ncbi:MAG: 3-hydroxyacyl-CoA dehydrogenase NAD-binding domain-containing protein [Nitriliruptorales bacterium]|nr:3-hydroxyacyl-CoA dehydrogenase NAD-binding domain-containing protein [Nitriliruptorales bacterium]
MAEFDGPVAIVGAGVMGRGIAYVSTAVAGVETRLVDLEQEQLDGAMKTIDRDLQAGVERGKVEEEAAERARELITTTTDVADGCSGAGLVIEAVVERMDVKHDVFRTAEANADADAVIATNTSAMSVTEIVSALDDPSRGVGMHFFNPVPKMKLCELIWGLQTSDATMDRAEAAADAMGKTPVRVNDLPGFATSRLNALIGNEGMRMLEERVASPEDIDTAVKLGLNHPMGPLEMGDLVGWDTRLKVLEYLADTLGDRFRPTTLQRRLVAAGRYGRKSGRGVYRYDEDGARLDEPSDLG